MIESKSLKTLEYSKILSSVASCAYSSCAQEYIMKLTPSVNVEEVKTLLMQTYEADKLLYEHCISPSLAIDDISDILKSAEKLSTLSIEDILKVGKILRVARSTKGLIENINDNSIVLLKNLCHNIYFNMQLEKEIAESFESESEVSDNASANLKQIRGDIKSCNARIKQKLSQYISSSNYTNLLQDNLVTMRNNRYVVPLKSECKGQIAGLIHDRSATGSTLFIEPIVIVELNNELRQLQLDEQKEIQIILSKFTNDIQRQLLGISQSFETIIILDAIFAKASYSKSIKGILPSVNNEGRVDIIGGRHPLIDAKKVVPVSVNIGKSFNTLVITGPNTGGKTVTLKLVGAMCLMAMTGLFIPTHVDSEVAVFENIFCDIGDEQSIEQNLSTFSSHLKNLVHISNNLTSNSLILLDELGAGTDPTEGSALAIAMIDYFRKYNCKTLTTSHYSELKEYSYATDGVCNASMDFNPKTFEPTYKLHIGLSGSSNALEIASTLGLKSEIINNAKSKLSSEKLTFDKIIASAENSRRDAEELKRQAEIEYFIAREESQSIVEIKMLTEKKQDELDNKLTKGFKNLLEDYAEEAEDLIAQLKEKVQQGDEQALFEARTINKKLQGMAVNNEREKEFEYQIGDIKVGDNIFVKSLNATACVVMSNDKKNEYTVKIGMLTCNIKKSDAQKIVLAPQKQQQKVKVIREFSNVACPKELNVIGQNCEEAIYNVQQYLSSAMLQGYNEVAIVHGKGTGALRKGLHEYFKTDDTILSFRLGKYGEGENGVTILTLK